VINRSEEELTAFFNLYGPSARTVYANASASTVDSKNYEDDLRGKIGMVSYDDLDKIFRQARALDLLDGVSHQIVLISPGEFRNQPQVSIPTRHIYGLLRDALFDCP
jgi:hypothetical protein